MSLWCISLMDVLPKDIANIVLDFLRYTCEFCCREVEKEGDLHTCEEGSECGLHFCDRCAWSTCDWCMHHKMECQSCPRCTTRLTLESKQIICAKWINIEDHDDAEDLRMIDEALARREEACISREDLLHRSPKRLKHG